MYRIGGDMEIDIPLLISPKKRDFSDITKRYPHYLWTDTGRSAIYLAIEDIEKRGCEKVVYLPSYICDAVVQPFKEKCFQVRFYSMGNDLNSPTCLPDKLDNEIFLFIHYFGYENVPIVEWLKDKKKNYNFFVIEDCAQAAFTVFKEGLSDYKIYSYRKFTPQPDGGLLISQRKLNIEVTTNIKHSDFLSAQIQGKIVRSLTYDDKQFLLLLKHSEDSLNKKITTHIISDFSIFLMERINFKDISEIRRKNWFLLYNFFKKNYYLKKFIYPLLPKLKNNEVPLGFPIFVQNGIRDELREYLIHKNIFCPIHWIISNNFFEEDSNLSSSILTLPIDQRMNEGQVIYLMNIISQFFSEVEK